MRPGVEWELMEAVPRPWKTNTDVGAGGADRVHPLSERLVGPMPLPDRRGGDVRAVADADHPI
jgi:hypothetical protein